MLVVAWSLALVLALMTDRVFLVAPFTAYARGLSKGADGADESRGMESNEVLRPDGDDDDDSEAGRDASDDESVYVFTFDAPSVEEELEEDETKRRNGEREEDGSEDSTSETNLYLDGSNAQNPLDPWSIVWYIGSFGGLVAFFLIVSCSEWCCRRGARPLSIPYAQRGEVISAPSGVNDAPPPPYHLFAPPPYDSINYDDLVAKAAGEKLDIYVISVPAQSGAPRQQQAPA